MSNVSDLSNRVALPEFLTTGASPQMAASNIAAGRAQSPDDPATCPNDLPCWSDGSCNSDSPPPPPPPVITYPDYTLDYDYESFTIYINKSRDFPYYKVYYRLASVTKPLIYQVPQSTRVWTHGGLSPRTSYVVNLGYSDDGSNYSFVGSTSFTTPARPIYITGWNWYGSNGSASSSQTSAAHAAVYSKGYTRNFSYLVWNDLVDKIYEALQVAGYSWNNRFATYDNTRMRSWDHIMTAARFNSARYNVGLHISTGLPTLYPGNPVVGSYFTTLTDALNTFIATL